LNPTQSQVLELFDYHPRTGVLRWKKPNSRRVRPGDKAGHVADSGYLSVRVDYRPYPVSHIVILMITGSWPAGRVKFRDGDPTNTAIDNLVDMGAAP
jgi:hypothetical protein